HLSTSQLSPPSPSETLTPLEQEVLDEYARLLGNLNNMSTILASLAANPSAEILDALRGLERKTSLVFTLLKASVYSIVLNQQIQDHDQGPEGSRSSMG
ncbi:DASH complex subunit Dad3-domain-containing protein, partial [Clohesyomyces aquaticus]